MPPIFPNTFLPSKKTRDFGVADTVTSRSDTTLYNVAAGTVIAPDTLMLLSSIGPTNVIEATTGTPVIGTDTVMGVSMTYSNNSSTAAGYVTVAKTLPGQSFRIKSNSAIADQAAVDALVGSRFTIASSTDSDGFIHQELNVSAGADPLAMLEVVDGDFLTDTLLVKIVG